MSAQVQVPPPGSRVTLDGPLVRPLEALDRAALAEGAIPRKCNELMALAVALTT